MYAPKAALYDLGPQHPLKLERVLLTWWLIEAYGLDVLPNVERLWVEHPATRATLELVHDPAFIDATLAAGHGDAGDWSRFGYGPGDNPIFPLMHEAAAFVAEASRMAAEAVWSGDVEHAFNAAGGLHHAMPARASGFCVYDDVAIAIAWLLDQGAERIAYVDIDVHHGDGPQAIFWNEPRVLTISIHEYGTLFPGTGGPEETGGPNAPGSALNVPLPAGTGDDGWLEAFHAEIPERVRAFQPQVLVTQLGADGHATDLLANLQLTTRAFAEAYASLHPLAHEVCDGRWIATGGGGYQWASVVPRVWTLAFAEMCGVADQLDQKLPQFWLDRASARANTLGAPTPPANLHD